MLRLQLLAAFLGFVAFSPCHAQREQFLPIVNETVWTVEESPVVLITGDILLEAPLTIEAGVHVNFTGAHSIFVTRGSVVLDGNETHPVRVSNGARAFAFPDEHRDATMVARHSIFENHSGGAITRLWDAAEQDASYGPISIHNCTFVNNEYAVYSADVELVDSFISGGRMGASLHRSKVVNVTIQDADEICLFSTKGNGEGEYGTVRGCTISNCGIGIQGEGTVVDTQVTNSTQGIVAGETELGDDSGDVHVKRCELRHISVVGLKNIALIEDTLVHDSPNAVGVMMDNGTISRSIVVGNQVGVATNALTGETAWAIIEDSYVCGNSQAQFDAMQHFGISNATRTYFTNTTTGLVDQQDTRVVGGTQVQNTTQYPFFVEWGDAKCGASLIHDDLALSAAHCENDKHPLDTQVYLLGLETEKGIPRYVERQVSHPQYTGTLQDYDFMILKLTESALVDKNGKPTGAKVVPLNQNASIPAVGDALTGMGFGKLNQHDQQTSDNFMEVEIYYISDTICTQQYGVQDFLSELMFCAGIEGVGGKDTCQGDSGGPIIHHETNTQVGVVSFGIGCALPDYAGVNARVSAVHEWITQQICELSDFPPSTCMPQRVPAPDVLPSGGTGAVTIHVKYDTYPEETAWSLRYMDMANGEPLQLFLHPFNDTIPENDYGSESFANLPAGNYSLRFGDQAGDGNCCTYGSGRVWLTDDLAGTTVWENNGSYGDFWEVKFKILDNSGQVVIVEQVAEYENSWEASRAANINNPSASDKDWPGGSPPSTTNAITINVKFDAMPHEVDWTLQKGAGSGVWSLVKEFDGATQGIANTLVSEEVGGLSEGWYYFSIRDSQNDGICCRYRKGWANIMGPGAALKQTALIWGTNGEFGSGEKFYFEVDAEGYISDVTQTEPGPKQPGTATQAPTRTDHEGSLGDILRAQPFQPLARGILNYTVTDSTVENIDSGLLAQADVFTKCQIAVPTPESTPGPTLVPTLLESTASPTTCPTASPTTSPTRGNTTAPTAEPTSFPTPTPTLAPTEEPTPGPTSSPTEEPSPNPTPVPTLAPSLPITPSPTTLEPTNIPTTSAPTKPTIQRPKVPPDAKCGSIGLSQGRGGAAGQQKGCNPRRVRKRRLLKGR